jgi:hypothetical protein
MLAKPSFIPGEDNTTFYNSIDALCEYFGNMTNVTVGGGSNVGADWDRWMNYVQNGGTGLIKDFLTGTKTTLIILPLGIGLPTLVIQMKTSSPNYQGIKMEIEIRVFGSGYSDYNYVQTYYDNWNGKNSKATFTWKIDGDNDHGFYYNEGGMYKKTLEANPWYSHGSQGYFQAEWTLCGHSQNGECWDQLGTFSWGYSYSNGITNPFFIPSDNSISEHIINVNEALKYWNKQH